MFGGRLWRSRCPIGIDFGTHSIKMLQLDLPGGGGARSVRAAAERALPSDLPAQGVERVAAIGQIIDDMMNEGGFRGRSVVTSLPAAAVQFKNLRLPRMPASELSRAVEWEAADRMYFDRNKVQLQFFDAGEVRQGDEVRQEIILMAAANDVVQDHLDMLAHARLEPLAIDVIPAALARFVNALPADQQQASAPIMPGAASPGAAEPRVILDVGRSASKVLIVRQGRIAFFKLIDIGEQTIETELCKRLSLSPHQLHELWQVKRDAKEPSTADPQTSSLDEEDAFTLALGAILGDLARELQLCLRYYSVTFRGRRPERVLLTGGACNQAMFAQLLAAQCGMATTAIRPFADIDTSRVPQLAHDAAQWAGAVGLSLRRPLAEREARPAMALEAAA